jgi:hypothetical protein
VPDYRCGRCRKQLTADKKFCSTCQTVEDCTSLDIGPAALAAFVADSHGGTAQDTACGGESDGGCAAADSGCCGGD